LKKPNKVIKITGEDTELIAQLVGNYSDLLEGEVLEFTRNLHSIVLGAIDEHGKFVGSAVGQELCNMICIMIQARIMGERNAKDGLIHALYNAMMIQRRDEFEGEKDEADKDRID